MKRFAINAVNTLRVLDAYASFRRTLMSQVAVLLFHRVCPKEDYAYLEPSLCLTPEVFETHIRDLSSQRYKFLSLNDLVRLIRSANPMPKRAAVVTFDDGYKDNYEYAYPILRRYGIPATVFLATGHINAQNLFWWDRVGYVVHHTKVSRIDLDLFGKYPLRSELDRSRTRDLLIDRLKRIPSDVKEQVIDGLADICQVRIPLDLSKRLMLSWREIEEMDNRGICFGAHSVSHTILTNTTISKAENEIIQSKEDIEDRLAKEVTAFSYPNGDFNDEIVSIVRGNGFECAVAILGRLVSSGDDLYRLSRIPVSTENSSFKLRLSGLWGDLMGLRRR